MALLFVLLYTINMDVATKNMKQNMLTIPAATSMFYNGIATMPWVTSKRWLKY